MTNHNHSDGVRPSLAQIRKRRADGWFDHTVEPTIDVLLEFAPHEIQPARGSSSDGTHCAVCRRGIWRKGLDEWAHVEVMA